MPGPFDPFPTHPEPTPGNETVALIADTDEEVEAYLRLAVPPSYVVVRSAADVPTHLGGMAILTKRELEPELRDALVTALAADPAP
jgi:hypothetical protein